MPPAVDHRRATAERNAAAILDATERLLARNAGLSMAAVAAEAGVSRPTVYAHYGTMAELIEAAVTRAIDATLTALHDARPEEGPAPEALDRAIVASWRRLSGLEALAGAAAEHLDPGRLQRAHHPLMARLHALVERGQREGAFRSDLPADWLVTVFYALVHAADESARSRRRPRTEALELLTATVHTLIAQP
jgi:AcrR family transcriptional regulator